MGINPRSIRSLAVAGLLSVSTAALPSAAQAGQDEEIFVLGALAGAAVVAVLGGTAAAVAQRTGINRIGRAQPVEPLAYGPDGQSDATVAYCQQRYRTYRVSDGTFQPNNGPRRVCVPPFAR